MLTTDSSSQLHVLGHDGHTLSMNGAHIGISKEANEITLSCFLQEIKHKVSTEDEI